MKSQIHPYYKQKLTIATNGSTYISNLPLLSKKKCSLLLNIWKKDGEKSTRSNILTKYLQKVHRKEKYLLRSLKKKDILPTNDSPFFVPDSYQEYRQFFSLYKKEFDTQLQEILKKYESELCPETFFIEKRSHKSFWRTSKWLTERLALSTYQTSKKARSKFFKERKDFRSLGLLKNLLSPYHIRRKDQTNSKKKYLRFFENMLEQKEELLNKTEKQVLIGEDILVNWNFGTNSTTRNRRKNKKKNVNGSYNDLPLRTEILEKKQKLEVPLHPSGWEGNEKYLKARPIDPAQTKEQSAKWNYLFEKVTKYRKKIFEISDNDTYTNVLWNTWTKEKESLLGQIKSQGQKEDISTTNKEKEKDIIMQTIGLDETDEKGTTKTSLEENALSKFKKRYTKF